MSWAATCKMTAFIVTSVTNTLDLFAYSTPNVTFFTASGAAGDSMTWVVWSVVTDREIGRQR